MGHLSFRLIGEARLAKANAKAFVKCFEKSTGQVTPKRLYRLLGECTGWSNLQFFAGRTIPLDRESLSPASPCQPYLTLCLIGRAQ